MQVLSTFIALTITLLFLIPNELSAASQGGSRAHIVTAGDVTAHRLAERPMSDSDGVLSKLQGALLKSFADWVDADDLADEDDDRDDGDEGPERQELIAQLQQVLSTASTLLQASRGCKVPGAGGSSTPLARASENCPVPAPELLQGGAAAFLASVLHTYPRGPSNRDDLVAWATAASAFLEEHLRLQQQQRLATERAANAAAAALAKAQTPAAVGPGGDIKAAAVTAAASQAATAPPARVSVAAATGRQAQARTSGQEEGSGLAAGSTATSERSLLRRQLQGPKSGEGRLPSAGKELPGADASSQVALERGSGSTGRTMGAGRALGGDREERALRGKGDGAAAVTVAAATALHITHHTPVYGPAAIAGGLPLVRRVLLAQLLLAWVTDLRQQLPPAPEVADALSQVLTKLYYVHVGSVVDRAALEFFHISKAGGTSWLAAAKANGCNLPRAKASRVSEFDDDCRWVDPLVLTDLGLTPLEASRTLVCPRYGIVERRSYVRDCSRRLGHFHRAGLHLAANEYTLHGGRDSMYGTHICPQFVTVTTIREPLERLVSNIRYTMVQLKREKNMPTKTFAEHFCNRSAADWEVYAPPVADNYNIRTLVGELAFHTPLYEIGEAHEAVAKQLLAQYDLVLDLNAGDKAAELLMRAGLGWNTTLADVHIWSSETLARKGGLDFNTCPVGDIEPLMARQEYDQRWYRFGRMLSHLDQLFLAAAANLGLRPWPSDWEERGMGPPPEDGYVGGACGLVGLVPPVPHVLVSEPPAPPRPPAGNWTAMVLAWKQTQRQQPQPLDQKKQDRHR